MVSRIWAFIVIFGAISFHVQISAMADETETAAHSAAIKSIAEAIASGKVTEGNVESLATESHEAVDATIEEPRKRDFTLWEFELEVKAFQHEPAAKSLDEFNTKMVFAAQHFHDENVVSRWGGFGDMTSNLISRGSHSFQAPHRPAPQFGVQANSFWNREAQLLSVRVIPQDAVTYSLTTGQVLGTTSILQHILPEAIGPGFQGTLETFTIPADVEPGHVFHATFDTSDKHVCWYEGKATLRVSKKYSGKMGLFKDLLKKHGIDESEADTIEVLPDSLVEEDRSYSN